MKQRRSLDVFSLSFLDCICCGFGSVILLFVLVNTRSDQAYSTDFSKAFPPKTSLTTMRTENPKVEEERLKFRLIQVQRENQQIQNEILAADSKLATTIEVRDSIIGRIQSIMHQIENQESNSSDSRVQIKQLQESLQILESEINKLQATIQSTKDKQEADQRRRHAGDGYRHYLTGLSLSGKRTLILMDCSASMLSDRIIDILRRRNMGKQSRQAAPKWRQAVAAADWLLSQLPVDGQFQFFGFNETVFPVLKHSSGQWFQAGNSKTLDEVSAALHDLAPEKAPISIKRLN